MDDLVRAYFKGVHNCEVVEENFYHLNKTRYRVIGEAVDADTIKKTIKQNSERAADPEMTRHNVTKMGEEQRKQIRSMTKEEVVIDYLVSEGYAKDKESALGFLEAMSDEWLESIVESFLTEAPYEIIHHSSTIDGTRVGPTEPTVVSRNPYKNKKRAQTKAEKMNQEYGAHVFSLRKTPDQ